ncbi:MAG: hypothetical protein KBA31_09000 [Alphaproteobacteria bacterium]|nr:hypothetical protein [Alphaproteobacteria bacterium]
MADQTRPLFIEFEGVTTSDRPTEAYEKTVWVTRLISVEIVDYEKSQRRSDQPAGSNK